MANITDNGELMDIFYEETQSLIDEMRGDLSTLSQERGTNQNRSSTLRRLFRCAHIIKTSSASVGFDDLNEVTKALESIFKEAGDEKFVITDDAASLLSESVEVCWKLLNRAKIVGHKELLDRLNSILQYCQG